MTREHAMRVPAGATAATCLRRLQLVRKLGAGCSATVHLARDKRNGKLYAVKCINIYDKSVREMVRHRSCGCAALCILPRRVCH